MCMNLALKMTIKYYYQAELWNTSCRLLECVLERKCFTSIQFMNFTAKKMTIELHSGVTIWM